MIFGFAIATTLVMLLMMFDTWCTHYQFQSEKSGAGLFVVQRGSSILIVLAFILNSFLLWSPSSATVIVAGLVSLAFWVYYGLILLAAAHYNEHIHKGTE